MGQSAQCEFWVIYRTTIPNRIEPMNAVCRQSEWEAMERAKPGYHQLLRGGIPHEAEAERLARGTRGDPKKRFSVEDVEHIE